MRYLPISSNLFVKNRKKFAKYLKANALAIFNSNDIMPTSADGVMPFQQNSDIFYLSGIDQEESILLLYPECKEEKHREILFLKETNEHIAVWEGEKLTKEKAYQVSGIKTVYWLEDFEQIFHILMSDCEHVYLNTNEHRRSEVRVETRDARFLKKCKLDYPLHEYQRAAPIMGALRSVKEPEEVELIQKACDITEKGFRRVLNFVKHEVKEYAIEAEYIHEFIKSGSKGFAYTPIIASGANACVLHYIENHEICKEGDLILMDVGAEYANYKSDMTRTIPVNGKFTPRQKAVYEAVLRVQKAAIKMLKVGNNINDYHKAVGELMTKELVDLNLISMEEVKNQNPDKTAYKKYFMHGTSHHLGLDVHDVSSHYADFAAGMVFTCEPGIYIPSENIGIRLEDDILITENGQENLMKNIPIEVDEIEDLMNG